MKKKYKVRRNDSLIDYPYSVIIREKELVSDEVVAEFWDYKDARSFCAFKNNQQGVEQL